MMSKGKSVVDQDLTRGEYHINLDESFCIKRIDMCQPDRLSGNNKTSDVTPGY